jgi:DNA-binding MarR family transcriptional regulator
VRVLPNPPRPGTGLARLAVVVQAATDARSAVAERTTTQQQILLLLAGRQRDLPLAELANELGLTMPGTLSALSTLVREGMVAMDPGPSYTPDGMRVELTDRGRRHAPQSNWAASKLAEVNQLDDDEQRCLLTLVTEEIAALQREDRIPVAHTCMTCRYFDRYAHANTSQPHHCWLVDAPFGNRELRLRCPDQMPAGESETAERPS